MATDGRAAPRGPFAFNRTVTLGDLLKVGSLVVVLVAWLVRASDTGDAFREFVSTQHQVDEKQDMRTEARLETLRTELRGDIRDVSAKLDRLLERSK